MCFNARNWIDSIQVRLGIIGSWLLRKSHKDLILDHPLCKVYKGNQSLVMSGSRPDWAWLSKKRLPGKQLKSVLRSRAWFPLRHRLLLGAVLQEGLQEQPREEIWFSRKPRLMQNNYITLCGGTPARCPEFHCHFHLTASSTHILYFLHLKIL